MAGSRRIGDKHCALVVWLARAETGVAGLRSLSTLWGGCKTIGDYSYGPKYQL